MVVTTIATNNNPYTSTKASDHQSVTIVETNNNTTIIPANRFTTLMEARAPYIISNLPPTSIETTDDTNTKLTNFQHLLNQLLQIDNSITTLPWTDNTDNSDESVPMLQGPFTLIGENIFIESLSTHFNRIQFKKRPKDTATWIDFRMEHTLPWKDIQHKLGRWMNYRNYGLYPRKIQEA